MRMITAKPSQPNRTEALDRDSQFHLRSVAFINDLHSLMSDFIASFARSSSRSCSWMFSRKYGLSKSASENSRGFRPMISVLLGWNTVAVFYIGEARSIVKRMFRNWFVTFAVKTTERSFCLSCHIGKGTPEQFPNPNPSRPSTRPATTAQCSRSIPTPKLRDYKGTFLGHLIEILRFEYNCRWVELIYHKNWNNNRKTWNRNWSPWDNTLVPTACSCDVSKSYPGWRENISLFYLYCCITALSNGIKFWINFRNLK